MTGHEYRPSRLSSSQRTRHCPDGIQIRRVSFVLTRIVEIYKCSKFAILSLISSIFRLCNDMAAPPPNCADRPNHPNVVACSAARRDCVDAAHGAPFSVCDTCAADTVGRPANVITQANVAQVAKPQLTRTGGFHSVGNPRFRTLLCDPCIRREKELRRARYLRSAPAAHTLAWTQRRFMEHYPHNTCTCRQKLRRQDRPRRKSHRHCAHHRNILRLDLEQARDVNEAWLESIKRNESWQIFGSRASTRNRRDAAGTFRACRCGNEVNARYGGPPGPPVSTALAAPPAVHPAPVYQCLACEGIIHVGPLPVLGTVRDFDPTRHNRDFRFGRARSTQRI